MRFISLIVFIFVGLLVAWVSQNAGMAAGTAFLVAFVPAVLAAAAVDWVAKQMSERKH